MPLSEDEKRILSEIEDHLYESDPDLVREVGSTTVYTHAFRSLRWAVVAFIVSLVAMVYLLSIHYTLSFGAFLLMLASALWAERSARRLGRAGWDQMSQTLRVDNMRDFFGSQGQRVRERIRREDEGDELD